MGTLLVAVAPTSATAAPSSSPELVPFTGSRVVSATWGAPSGGYHPDGQPAIDVAMPVGTPIYAAGAGAITFTATDNRTCNPNTYPGGIQGCIGTGILGTRIHLRHPDSTTSRYYHLSSIASGISVNASVSAGQLLGYSGNSGISTGPHLHYDETNAQGTPVNPGSWTACHSAASVTYDNLQARKGQTIRNDGFSCSTTPPPPPDLDGDGVPDQSDLCLRFPGPSNTSGCASEDVDGGGMSDFNGDGRSDVAAFYNYPGDDAAAFVMRGTANGLAAPAGPVWRPGAGNWELARSRFVSGDFNGDGRSDVAVFYDYPGADAAAFVMRGTDSGLAAPGAPVWRSGVGNWELARSRFVSGDFNGDGKTDVAAFYDYSGASAAAFIFRGTASGLSGPVSVWQSGGGNWELTRSRFVSGDVDQDGKSDIAVFYDYSNADAAAFVMRGTATGLTAPGAPVWRSGPGMWELSRTRLVGGDFNGDGKSDVAAFYDYPGADAGAFIFRGNGAGLSAPASTWRTGTGQWEVGRSRFVSGDFNGDLKSDVGVFYDYPGSDAAAFVMKGTDVGLTAPGAPVWRSGPGNWELGRTRLVGGGAFVRPVLAPSPLPAAPTAPPTSTTMSPPGRMNSPKVTVRRGKVALTWQPPAVGGNALRGYVVDLSKGKDRTTPASSRKLVLKKLEPGRYKVRIAARNDVGTSPFSAWVRFRVR